jgi:hypothetical protein
MSARVRTHYVVLLVVLLLVPVAFVVGTQVVKQQRRSDAEIAVTALDVGDCFRLPVEDAEVRRVRIQSCDEPHEAEVYARFNLDRPTAPDDDSIRAEAQKGCTTAFERFVGRPFDSRTRLRIFLLRPYNKSWDTEPDHAVRCAVYDPAGEVTLRTLRNSNR